MLVLRVVVRAPSGCTDYLEVKWSTKKQKQKKTWREKKYIKIQHMAGTFQNLNWHVPLRCRKSYNKIPNKNIPFKDPENIYVYPWFPQLVNEIGTVYSTGAHANLQPSALLSSVRYHKIACFHIQSLDLLNWDLFLYFNI